jgi:large subunit ribosomal protein L4
MAEKKKTGAKKAAAPAAKAPRARAQARKAAPRKAAARRRDISEDDTARFVREKSGAVRPAGEGSTVPVVDAGNNRVRDVALRPEVFGVEANAHLMWEAVKEYRAAGRRGTHMTKNRALVSGTGRKPWRQKGTGRARVGEIRNPLWRKGGTVFGPQPRSYGSEMPKKVKRGALLAALAQKLNDGAVIVVDRLESSDRKTKSTADMLKRLGATGKTLVIDVKPDEGFAVSARNIGGVTLVASARVTARDVVDTATIVATRAALETLQETLGNRPSIGDTK